MTLEDHLGRSEKMCHDCEIRLPLSAFKDYVNGRGEVRWRRVCKECRAAANRASQAWRDKESPEVKAQRDRRSAVIRINGLFGITEEEFQAMRVEQGDTCAICNKPETRTRAGKVLRLCIDHNAETGQIRGLLCSKCNVAIGMLDHDPFLLEQAVQYLTKYDQMQGGSADGKV